MKIAQIKSTAGVFFRDEAGASAVEYAILAASIIAVLVLTILVLGQKTNGLFEGMWKLWDSISK